MPLTIRQENIEITAEKMGEYFVNADDTEQAEFLIGMLWAIQSIANGAGQGWWSFQCRHITDNQAFSLRSEYRLKIASLLEDLVFHLKDPTESQENA